MKPQQRATNHNNHDNSRRVTENKNHEMATMDNKIEPLSIE